MNGLADVDGFKIFIQVCVWLGFPPLLADKTATFSVSKNRKDTRVPLKTCFNSLNPLFFFISYHSNLFYCLDPSCTHVLSATVYRTIHVSERTLRQRCSDIVKRRAIRPTAAEHYARLRFCMKK